MLRPFTLPRFVDNLIEAFITASLIEECTKFLYGYLVIRRAKPQRRIDYALLFGAVGLGYQTAETLMVMGSVVSAVVGGVFVSHIIWQYWMGLYLFDYQKAKAAQDKPGMRKGFLLAFVIPILLHGLNDFVLFMLEDATQTGSDEQLVLWLLATILWIGGLIAFFVITMKKMSREVKIARKAKVENGLPSSEGAAN